MRVGGGERGEGGGVGVGEWGERVGGVWGKRWSGSGSGGRGTGVCR